MEIPNKIQDFAPNVISEAEAGTAALLCAPPCNGAVCIPRTRYDELMRAEIELDILRHAYQTMDKFDIGYVLDAIFNSKFKFNPQDTAKTAAVSKESAAGAE